MPDENDQNKTEDQQTVGESHEGEESRNEESGGEKTEVGAGENSPTSDPAPSAPVDTNIGETTEEAADKAAA